MPELPEVNKLKIYLESTSLHKRIRDVKTGDDRIFEPDGQTIRKALKDHSLESAKRHGKFVLVKLDSGDYLILHFGMTGKLAYYKGKDDPEYSQLLLRFDNGYSLAYTCMRKLGRVGLTEDYDSFLRKKGLGPDALKMGEANFLKVMGDKRGVIKTALMDQGTIAGLGNLYVDEVLFQEKIHPKTKVSSLSEKQLNDLYRSIKTVLQTVIDADGDPAKLPDTYLRKHREEEGKCPRCGSTLRRIKIGGRSTWFCPSCQE